jgi:hypothetical protein
LYNTSTLSYSDIRKSEGPGGSMSWIT